MSEALTHLSVATAQCQSQLVLQFVKIGELLLHIGELFFQSAAHGRTRLKLIPSQPQQCSHLAELESQTLDTANKSESFHIAFSVLTESTLRSWGSREQCIAFVESNRVNARPIFFATMPICMALTPS